MEWLDTFYRNYGQYVLEILIIAVIIYILIRFLQGTLGEGIFKGLTLVTILMFFVLYWLATHFRLRTIEFLFQHLTAAFVVALIVIFQPELRRGLVRISTMAPPFLQPILHSSTIPEIRIVEEVKRAVLRMSKNRIGAIIALERDVGLGSYTEGGTPLLAEVQSELLETIFFPGSALHDGAVVIQEHRVAAAGCLFPLTENPQVARNLGTRHRAGIGLTEKTDAIAVIVSEETGSISVAAGGKLDYDLDQEQFDRALQDLYIDWKART
ncbi:MAG: diadenylate cyclase CdaA [Planctomycetota bacterium]|jgi:diadenylate cyclase